MGTLSSLPSMADCIVSTRLCAVDEEIGTHAQNDERPGQIPSGLLHEVARTLHTDDLIAAAEVRGQSTAFAVLDEYNAYKQNADDENEDDDESVH
jgi:hypothetical protein